MLLTSANVVMFWACSNLVDIGSYITLCTLLWTMGPLYDCVVMGARPGNTTRGFSCSCNNNVIFYFGESLSPPLSLPNVLGVAAQFGGAEHWFWSLGASATP